MVSGNLAAVSGSTGDIAAGGSSTAIGVTISTATAGTVSGTVGVALTSDGTGVDTLGTTPLGTPVASYNAAGNFSTASNPNGVWSYRDNGAVLTTAGTGSNYARWSNNQAIPNSASITENTTTTTQNYSNTINLPVGYLNLDPESLANAAVQFTAPTAGVYTFTGSFLGTDTGEQAHAVAISVNGTTVQTGTITSYGQSVAINLTETLAAGGTAVFASDTGAWYSNLSTGLSLAVSASSGTLVPVSVTIDNYATAAIQQSSAPAP